MSTAMLNVWITDIGDPCHIIKPHPEEQWYVHVVDCDGRVVEWCGRRYRDIPAKCGHAEFELPPGCYAVLASHSREHEGVGEFGNRLTHVQIVRVNCGDHACVTLFSPSAWHCGTWFKAAIEMQLTAMERAGVKPETARRAIKAIDALLEQLPIDAFTRNMEELKQPATE